MKVSLRRKIHIMALPQETFLNARWSEDQSAAIPCQPEGLAKSSATFLAPVSALSRHSYVKSKRLKQKNQTKSKKYQYNAQSSTLRRTSFAAQRRCTFPTVQVSAITPPSKCSPCIAVIR